MKKINFLDIFKNAFLLTWRHKFLWFFGFIIFISSIISSINLDQESIIKLLKLGNLNMLANNNFATNTIAVIFLMVFIALFLLKILATASIIKSVSHPEVYSQTRIKTIFGEAKIYLRIILLLEVSIILVGFLLAIILVSPAGYLVSQGAKTPGTIMAFLAILILAGLFITGYFLEKYATYYIVLGNMPIRLALENGYILLEKNWKSSLTMGLYMLGFNLLFVFLFGIILTGIFSLGAALSFAVYLMKVKALLIGLMSLAGLAIIIGSVTLIAWFTSFTEAAWIIFFENLALDRKDDKKEEEKINLPGEIPTPETV